MVVKKAAVRVAGTVFNGIYGLCRIFGHRRNEVLFVSRKSSEPSYDYLECGKAFSAQGYQPVYLSQHFKKSSVFAYGRLVLRELYHLAHCKVCVIDRYDPVISLLNFDCEPTELNGARHLEFPSVPVVIQLWHAFGAFKKFGYQALDVAEGHSLGEAALFKIHRNNSWVVCSGEDAREAFAEAFACPVERVIPFGRPEYRKLCDIRQARDASGRSCNATGRQGCYATEKPKVLFAPTIRKYDTAANPFDSLQSDAPDIFQSNCYSVSWSAHPLTKGNDAGGDVPVGIVDADIVVTDYSSIVYEAYLLGKKVCFYAPDIDHYRLSPGLNADPALLCPRLVAADPAALAKMLNEWVSNPASYPYDEFCRFVGGSFVGCSKNPAEDIASFAIRCVENNERMF